MKPSKFYPDLTAASSAPVLNRALLRAGGAIALARRDAPGGDLITDADRASSLATFLSSRPGGDLWVFGYGSLIWNPAFKSVESRTAHVEGWHRSFCFSMIAGRGTPDRPGLALGLDQDGRCVGIAYQLDEHDVLAELGLIWSREMLLGGYRPEWVDVRGDDGYRFGSAVTFVIDRQHHNYVGASTNEELVHRLATAVGSWGSSAEYLFCTADTLCALGIPDPKLEKLARLVRVAMAKMQTGISA